MKGRGPQSWGIASPNVSHKHETFKAGGPKHDFHVILGFVHLVHFVGWKFTECSYLVPLVVQCLFLPKSFLRHFCYTMFFTSLKARTGVSLGRTIPSELSLHSLCSAQPRDQVPLLSFDDLAARMLEGFSAQPPGAHQSRKFPKNLCAAGTRRVYTCFPAETDQICCTDSIVSAIFVLR